MLNFKNIPRYHLLFLLLVVLFSARATAADTLLILGDSLSAGYHLPVEQSWPVLMDKKWQKSGNKITVINGSISGNTAAQGLERLPELLKQHKPRWVLIELGANDGLRGFPPQQTEQDLQQIITLVKQANIQPLLMQIRLPPNYGRRYTESFAGIYPKLAEHNQIPLLPFYMEQVAIKPEWVQQDGLHPNLAAQPFIADWISDILLVHLNHS
ncbi:multifunctional acyl-CoA thioesterase I/protease I/lysophospholipase L1 [Photorhabdus temperata]|uniref:Thioesterase 1/protease 1/lysophospholipase L1 n=3 Tax=Photorhabdus TaxID=29487 RepID=A0A4R4J3C5_9GAMM|nr:multifunctional acyl-CoA thioesterase I/protease I/lysophospholipase L1 [Photorhabdus khanii]NHB97195.1 multifunctional acyl-CoA thioesterase I/protease I/lysophospholipase L1 [Photorhabdus stackebrandtii]OHV53551.1 multifunctional acyl-CoA thioesterase I/protease I/lysophospholipase L1 [Photorhabdus temperata]TDB47997.1 multifunctional acyl-CoA thioesterase I/protease I/lysophospholipase L1 [Photorhabdus khanii subsp. guanajuatensis]